MSVNPTFVELWDAWCNNGTASDGLRLILHDGTCCDATIKAIAQVALRELTEEDGEDGGREG